MESENLKSKITQFVKGFRESFNRLLEEEKKKVSPSFKVVTRIPCQITVVWITIVLINIEKQGMILCTTKKQLHKN